MTQLNCDDAVYRSYIPTAKGAYRLSYDIDREESYIGYLSGNSYKEVFRSESVIRGLTASPSGRLTFSVDGKLLSLSDSGGQPEVLVDLAEQYYDIKDAEDILLARTDNHLYATDGTEKGTQKIADSTGTIGATSIFGSTLYFGTVGRDVWQYHVGSASATKILDGNGVSDVSWLSATQHAGVVALHNYDQEDGKIFAISSTGDARRLRRGEDGPEISSSDYIRPLTVDGLVLFVGGYDTPGLFVSDGTDKGTRRLLDQDFNYGAETEISVPVSIGRNQVLFALGSSGAATHQLYHLDLKSFEIRSTGQVRSGV